MGSHSVTCYPTQVNTPRLNPSHAGRYSIYLPRRDGRLSWPSWPDSAPAGSRTNDLSITSPTLNQCNHQGMSKEQIRVGLNMHRLMESDFWYDVICSRWRPWRHFTQKSAAVWWVHTQHLPGAYAAASASSWSIENSHLLAWCGIVINFVHFDRWQLRVLIAFYL